MVGPRGGGRRREAAGRQRPPRPAQKAPAAATTRTAGGRDVSPARGAVPRVRVRREHAQKLHPDRGTLEAVAPERQKAIGTFDRWPVFPAPNTPSFLLPTLARESRDRVTLAVPAMRAWDAVPTPSRSLPWRPPQRLDGASPAVCGGGPLFWFDFCFYFYFFQYIETSEDHEK